MSPKPLVVVCVKPVPLGEPRVERGQVVTEGMAWGLPASERRAVGAARAAADAVRGELAALALGPAAAGAGLREALALGAERGLLVEAPEGLDGLATSRALAAAAKRLGKPAVLVAAAESSDAQQGLTGAMLAELLGLDLVAGVERVQPEGGALALSRAAGREEERVLAKPPVAFTASARYQPAAHATSWGVGEAWAKPLQTVPLAELGAPAEPAAELRGLARPERARAEAERYEGDADESAAQLVRRLRAGGWVA